MPIRVLSPDVAAKIAAGEVIERPASVVKELIENAIDAAATTIYVEIRQAGRQLIRVSDDGCGIPAAEVQVAFARHATSKLQSVDDLDHLHTLGFRGEALASIAAVSHVTLLTRAADESVGTRVRLQEGLVASVEPFAHPRGSTFNVENLFYNVPARLKFLRSDATERKHIDDLIARYAMAWPPVRFSLQNQDRLVLRTPGSGALMDVLIEVYGLEAAQAMIQVELEEEGLRVSGYVGRPEAHRAGRDQMTLFVNGRWIQDASLTFAVEQAYHTMLPQGRHPLAVLRLTVPPEELDVNIHPTKSEVKFQRRDVVFRAVQRAVRESLLGLSAPPSAGGVAWGEPWPERVGGQAAQLALNLYRPPAPPLPSTWQPAQSQPEPEPPTALPPLRVIGQVAQMYIIAEGPQGLYLIDQHAAHERVLYEQLIRQHEQQAVSMQALIEPLPVELTLGQAEELEVWLEPLGQIGFEIEPFGGSTVLLRSVPAVLARADVRQALSDLLDELAAGEEPLAQETHQRLAAAACKRGAVKAGQVLSPPEMVELIARLEQCAAPRTCPHGRPTMILLSQGWMEREFGRR